MPYADYWKLKRSMGFYEASENEKELITSTISSVRSRYEKLKLIDLGCGDGRLARTIDFYFFDHVVLCDTTSIVFLAEKRIRELQVKIPILSIQDTASNTMSEISEKSVVFCSGLVSLFSESEQFRFLNSLLRRRPLCVILGVPRFNFFGAIYIAINFLRGAKARNLLLSILCKINSSRTFSRIFSFKIFRFLIPAIVEPLISDRIYRLSEVEYKYIFVSHGYDLASVKSSGWGTMFSFVRQFDVTHASKNMGP
jgi:hypothetical protein